MENLTKQEIINRFTVNGIKITRDSRKYIDGIIKELDMVNRDGETASYYEDGGYIGVNGSEDFENLFVDSKGYLCKFFELFTQEEIKKDFICTDDCQFKNTEDEERESYRNWDNN